MLSVKKVKYEAEINSDREFYKEAAHYCYFCLRKKLVNLVLELIIKN